MFKKMYEHYKIVSKPNIISINTNENTSGEYITKYIKLLRMNIMKSMSALVNNSSILSLCDIDDIYYIINDHLLARKTELANIVEESTMIYIIVDIKKDIEKISRDICKLINKKNYKQGYSTRVPL